MNAPKKYLIFNEFSPDTFKIKKIAGCKRCRIYGNGPLALTGPMKKETAEQILEDYRKFYDKHIKKG